jgi:hypothetical protein
MSSQFLEPMGDATQWTALRPDAVTPSTEVEITDEQVTVGHGADGRSLKVVASPAAAGHLLHRTLPAAVDITDFTELRLSIRANRRAGVPGAPFFLELSRNMTTRCALSFRIKPGGQLGQLATTDTQVPAALGASLPGYVARARPPRGAGLELRLGR